MAAAADAPLAPFRARSVSGQDFHVPHPADAEFKDARRVLVAIDGSKSSEDAVEWALNHLLRKGDYVLSIAVGAQVNFVYGADGGAWPDSVEVLEAMRKDGIKALQKKVLPHALRFKEKGYETGIILELGDTRELILHAAKQFHMDCIVMGCRGLGTIKRAFLGSVSSHIVHHAERPVVVVRDPKHIFAAKTSESLGDVDLPKYEVHFLRNDALEYLKEEEPLHEHKHTRTVMIAIDGSDTAAAAVTWALENAIDGPTDRLVLCNIREPVALPVITTELMQNIEKDHRIKVQAFAQPMALAAARSGVEDVRLLLAAGDARDALLQFARMYKVGLLVVGTRGMGSVKRLLLGSVSSYAIHNADCPVAVVRPPQHEDTESLEVAVTDEEPKKKE